MAGGSSRTWYHKQLGRMETEKLLMESEEDGSFLIRASDTVKGAYVLSTIYQQRIHHYRIIPNEEGMLSIQAQQGVQKKQFTHLDDMVEYYSHSRRGLVCALTIPIPQRKLDTEEEVLTANYDSDDDNETEADSEPREKDEKNLVSKFLLAFLSTMDTSKVEESFLEQVRQYLNRDVSVDIESMTTPTPHLSCFKQLFHKDCLVLHKQLNKMMVHLELMKSLFERAGGANATSTRRLKSSASDVDYDSLGFKLSDCAESVSSLETIAFQMLRELSTSMSDNRGTSSNSLVQPVANGIVKRQTLPREGGDQDEVTFEVKVDQGLSGRKNLMILVNLKECRFQFFKPGDSQRNTFKHNELLQLVKSRSRDTRLGVVFHGQSRKEYIFNDMQAREHFCQLTQLIRNRMLAGEDQDIISIFVGTWNMGDASPPTDITSWTQSLGLGKTLPMALAQPHDLYAFGTQETAIAEKEWIAKLRQTLKALHDIDYEKVVCQGLWGMRCVIMAKPEHMNRISHVQTSSVKTGIGNTLGNKGGVGISFFFGSISLGFICTHLTSGNEKCSRRNQNYHDILKGMSSLKQKKLSQFDLTNQFSHLFFFGDLNYRVDLGATEIVEYAKKFDHYSIYQEDQLRKEKEKKAVFVGYEETPILFPPTYRFQRGSRTLDDYVWVKQKRAGIRINVPSYCDRVLWRSHPGTSIVNTSYGCSEDIVTSDHSPVFATFQMHGFKQYASDAGNENKNAHIVVEHCNAKIATTSKTLFYMEFYSACLEGSFKTQPNNDFQSTSDSSYTCPVWKPTRDSLASFKPIVKEEGYLEQQHVLIMLKSQEGDEPYAECCVALRGTIGQDPITVARELTHQGHAVGELEIAMHVTLDTYRVKKTEEELYTEVNFITQDEPAISLDKPGARRVRGLNSESEIKTARDSLGSRVDNSKTIPSRDSLANRPRLPIPRANSQSGMDRHRGGVAGASIPSSSPSPSTSSSSTQPPPPLPRRRDLNAAAPLPVSQRPPMATPSSSSRPMDVLPPALPIRRGGDSIINNRGPFSRSEPGRADSFERNIVDPSRSRNATANAPVPAKRKATRQYTSPTPTMEQNSFPPPPTSRLHSAVSMTHPPVPVSSRLRQPSDSLPPMPTGAVPPVPKRQGGARSPRPPSSVESLLQAHGMQHFTDRLLNNGYDDLHFLAEVPDTELQEIGITQPSDREKLLRVFRNYAAHNH